MSYYKKIVPCCGTCLYFKRSSRNLSRTFAAHGGGECLNKNVVVIRRLPSYKPLTSTCYEPADFTSR